MNTRGDAREAHDLPKSVGAHGDAGAPARESAEVLHRDTLGRQGPQRGMTRARGGGGVTHDLPATDGKGLAGAPDCEGAEGSGEHTSELQARVHFVCRVLLVKKKGRTPHTRRSIREEASA